MYVSLILLYVFVIILDNLKKHLSVYCKNHVKETKRYSCLTSEKFYKVLPYRDSWKFNPMIRLEYKLSDRYEMELKKMTEFLYEKLSKQLKQKILSGEWQIGFKLPGELELTKEYGVGRSTVREALNVLQHDSLICKKDGIGAFVRSNRPLLDNPLLWLDSIGQMIKSAGYDDISCSCDISYVKADEKISEFLNLEKGAPVICLRRGRIARRNGQSEMRMGFSKNIIPEYLIGNKLEQGLEGSIFDFFQNRCGITISYADTEICGLDFSREDDCRAAGFLKSPAVVLKQLHYDYGNRPIMYSYDYLNSDSIKIRIKREKRG